MMMIKKSILAFTHCQVVDDVLVDICRCNNMIKIKLMIVLEALEVVVVVVLVEVEVLVVVVLIVGLVGVV